MIRNYFKIAWRNLRKYKIFSIINILGLAIGVAAFWLIALYVTDELSYDRYNLKADRIFRVVQHGTWNGGSFNLAVTSAPYAQALKSTYPEVEDAVRIYANGGGKITVGEKKLNVDDILFADNSIFNIFTYHFLYGDATASLKRPQCIVLTKALATKLFGDASFALNKVVYFDNNFPNTVTGVIDDVPANSHFTFSALRSFDTGFTGTWSNATLFTYLLLNDHEGYKQIEAQSTNFFNKFLKPNFGDVHYQMELQPLTSIHLHSNLDYEISNNGNITYIYVFSGVALLILIIAIINYVNLTTARSSVRIKEIGIRKVIGSGRRQLILMFFTESVLLTVIATLIAAFIIQAALPYFNNLSGKNLSLLQIDYSKTIAAFIGFSLITGILSGIYPALFLSGFRTIPAMKGQLGSQASTIVFRKSLVVFQFIITIVMIAGSCIIYQQLKYVSNKDLGFNKAQTLTFHIRSHDARTKVAAIKQQLLQNPSIESVGVAGNPIGNNDIGLRNMNTVPGSSSVADTKLVEQLAIDEDFIPTMQIKLVQGRNFSNTVIADKDRSIIVNQTLVDEMGWKDAVGRTVSIGPDKQGKPRIVTIIGVVKDFNTYSLQHKIAPMMLQMSADAMDGDNLYLRISKNNIQGSLNYISKVYGDYDPENKAEFHFLDQNFAHQYQTEEKQGNLLMVFTILAIAIACLGLFGLVTFTAEQRVKEIGIRKVLGAGINDIVKLLSGELIKLVLISTLIAAPIAWWAMNKWLQGFAYRIGVEWWVLVIAGGVTVLIAFSTVSIQAIRSAIANPVKSLRSE
jgi:putative ABC transport system permease protein